MKTWARFLAGLVVLKLLLFAWALPAFEGTDEPFHLDRARAFAESPLGEGWGGRPLAPEVVSAVRSSPCGPDLQRAFGCPAYGRARQEGGAAWGNLLTPEASGLEVGGSGVAGGGVVANYQNHQPPLYHAVAGAILRMAGGDLEPRAQLLVLRLFAVLLVILGTGLCLSFLAPSLRWGLPALLLLPGAAEALVRAGNDAPVFAWSAALLAVVLSRTRARGEGSRFPLGLFLLAACGPLIKLTAIPVIAFAAVERVGRRRWREGAALALGGLVVFPLQLARGWAWGGTLELNAPPTPESLGWGEPVLGILHSAYTFLKTALWLGGWSVFRPPGWVLVAAVVLVLAGLFLVRLRRPPRRLLAHVTAAALAAGAFAAFAIGKYRTFGVWGAVGGWYFWGWLPWVLLILQDLYRRPEDETSARSWAVAAAAFLLMVNIAWLTAAHRLYGG